MEASDGNLRLEICNLHIMSSTLKERIIDAIDKSQDNKLLSIVYSVIEAYENCPFMGYDTKGNPLSSDDIQRRLTEASDRMDSGTHVSSEEMRKRVASWQ